MHPVFTTHLAPTTSRLAVRGELDLASRDRLRWRLAQADQFSRVSVQLDTSGVTYVDASCLRVVEDTRLRLEASGRILEVVAASREFAMISDLAGYVELAAVGSPCGSAAGNRISKHARRWRSGGRYDASPPWPRAISRTR